MAAPRNARNIKLHCAFQHTATRRWLPFGITLSFWLLAVSTHSHPKVAAAPSKARFRPLQSFNTQPPEGGCQMRKNGKIYNYGFNTQPPEGGCIILTYLYRLTVKFQHTATRRWLQTSNTAINCCIAVSTHSHPKVAACSSVITTRSTIRFQHTATRRWLRVLYPAIGTNPCCFNTQPPEGGCRRIRLLLFGSLMFQHTATRRWLQEQGSEISALNKVSTHSHPKVAAANLRSVILLSIMFQHTATRRWLRLANYANCFCQSFQHTATRRWLP